jgi:Tfp pilus assembly protein PilX
MLHLLCPLRYVIVIVLSLQFVNSAAAAEPEWLYTVNPGDTLIGVAVNYLANPNDWRQLQILNDVTEPRRLMPGTKLRLPVALLKREAVIAEVIHVHGKVTHTSKNDHPQNLIAGARLEVGDIIETSANASVSMRFVDGSRLLLTQNTQVNLAKMMLFGKTGMAKTIIELNRGSLDNHIAEQQKPAARYEIKSPALNLVVRGTQFRAHVSDIDHVSRSEVLDGAMEASGTRGETVTILAGFGTLAAPGESPRAPQALSVAPDLSSVPSLLQRVPLRFEWPATVGAERYHAQVFADRSFEQLLLDGVFQDNAANWSDLPDGRYVLRVRSIDNNGLEGANADREFMLKTHPESPSISAPQNGQKVYGSQATLRWSASNAVQVYHVQLAAKPDFSELLVDLPEQVNNEYAVSLAPGQYYWRIASVAAGQDQGPFSDVQSFIQHKAPPDPPSLSAPQNGQKVYGSQATLRWSASNAVQVYHVQLAANQDFSELLVDLPEQVDNEYVVSLAPGQYYWRIAAVAAGQNQGPFSDVQSFTQHKAPPEPPSISAPQNGQKIYGSEVTLRWNASNAAHFYHVQLAAKPDFSKLLVDLPEYVSNEYVASLAPGQYYWRIASVAAGQDQGPFSDVQSFIKRKIPESPQLEPPQIDDKRLLFCWHKGEAGEKFQVQVARNPDFTQPILDNVVNISQSQIDSPEPGIYYLRVKTLDADGFAGPFGPVQQIEVPTKTNYWWLLLLLVPFVL